jgi:SAM-dependent methyltransferase
MRIDFGCGQMKEPGTLGVDNVALSNVDIVHDLNELPYPFNDNCCDEAYLKHVLEHFSPAEAQSMLREIQRVLKPGGLLHIRVPHAFSVAAWTDPTHRTGFTFLSPMYYDRASPLSYYKETESSWRLLEVSSRVTCFNWKMYRLKMIDGYLSRMISLLINRLLQFEHFPGTADLLIKQLPIFFVEIRFTLQKLALSGCQD